MLIGAQKISPESLLIVPRLEGLTYQEALQKLPEEFQTTPQSIEKLIADLFESGIAATDETGRIIVVQKIPHETLALVARLLAVMTAEIPQVLLNTYAVMERVEKTLNVELEFSDEILQRVWSSLKEAANLAVEKSVIQKREVSNEGTEA